MRNAVCPRERAGFARKEDVEVRGASAACLRRQVAQFSFEVVGAKRECGKIVRNIRRLFGVQLNRCLTAVERFVKESCVGSVESPGNCTLIPTLYMIARSL